MTSDQAKALLELLADLYRVASEPNPARTEDQEITPEGQ